MVAAAGQLALEGLDAFRRGDTQWMIDHSHPDLVLREPAELFDKTPYYGPAGLIRAFEDWPKQWETFEIPFGEVVDEAGDRALLHIRQHLRARDGLEFDLDVFNVFHYEEGKARSWDMFLTLDEAQARFAELAAR